MEVTSSLRGELTAYCLVSQGDADQAIRAATAAQDLETLKYLDEAMGLRVVGDEDRAIMLRAAMNIKNVKVAGQIVDYLLNEAKYDINCPGHVLIMNSSNNTTNTSDTFSQVALAHMLRHIGKVDICAKFGAWEQTRPHMLVEGARRSNLEYVANLPMIKAHLEQGAD